MMKNENGLRALEEQRRLLRMEYEEEKKAFSIISQKIGLSRLAARGDAWTDIKIGRVFYNSINQRCVEIIREETDDDDHHFEYGRPVAFLSLSGDPGEKPKIAFTGTVNFVDGPRMVVAILIFDTLVPKKII